VKVILRAPISLPYCHSRPGSAYGVAQAGKRKRRVATLRLRFHDINWRQGKASIWATKTYKEHEVHLTDRVQRLLRRLRGRSEAPGARSTPSCSGTRVRSSIDQSRLTRRMKTVLEKAAVEREHGLYDLRHTFVTANRSLKNGPACNTFATREGKNLSHPPESNRRPADYESIPGRKRRTRADNSSAATRFEVTAPGRMRALTRFQLTPSRA